MGSIVYLPWHHADKRLLIIGRRVFGVIEGDTFTFNSQLKSASQIAHTRHRSPTNFLVNLIAGLIVYVHQPKKPSLSLSDRELALLPVCWPLIPNSGGLALQTTY
jgi:hypothetical protein